MVDDRGVLSSERANRQIERAPERAQVNIFAFQIMQLDRRKAAVRDFQRGTRNIASFEIEIHLGIEGKQTARAASDIDDRGGVDFTDTQADRLIVACSVAPLRINVGRSRVPVSSV
jgi:hypothetical protein